MKLAISTLADRISPVFDVARQLRVVEVDHSREVGSRDVLLEEREPLTRARRVAALGVQVLICGAVSRPLEKLLLREGIRVLPQRCGPVVEVLGAFLSGQLTEDVFRMPGCCRRRRRGGRR